MAATFAPGIQGAIIRLYNTLTRTVEPLPIEGSLTRVYVCGITPYDTTHLGHAFTYSAADLLVRVLEARGRSVVYVQNVTDIDDDILRKAKETGENWRVLGDKWTGHYIDDMITLNVRPPDELPRASQAIPEILQAVHQLLHAGLAYEAGGSVYYDLAAYPDYGRLSRLTPDEMLPIANERGNDPTDPNKRRPLDFVLWQAQRPAEPAWPSPWGMGRPGWHIECSSLVQKYLGQTLDVHGGGQDLVFPHHESEIAQIEPLTGQAFSRHWMHTSMVHSAGQKMSKSLGNLVMVDQLRRSWSSDAIRVYLSSHHYRSVWSYSEPDLRQAAALAEAIRAGASAAGGEGKEMDFSVDRAEFDEALANDLDSPLALEVLKRLAGRIKESSGRGGSVAAAQRALRAMGAQLGLRLGDVGPEGRVVSGWEGLRTQYLRTDPRSS